MANPLDNLIPIKDGNDKRRYTGGRPTKLSDPDYCRLVAEWFTAGATRKAMAEEFGVTTTTITQWRRDPRVRAIVSKLIEDRILQVTRKTDSEIERRLMNADELSVKELIEIRKEYLGGALRAQTERSDDETTSQALDALEKNPELAAAMIEVLKNGKPAEESVEVE